MEIKKLKKSIRISLGNMVNGKFDAEKIFFYHLECLMSG